MKTSPICRPVFSQKEREMVLRDVERNGADGTRFFIHGEPVSVYPAPFNAFTLYGPPCPMPEKTPVYHALLDMGMSVQVVDSNDPCRPGLRVVKALSTHDSFEHTFLRHITPRANKTM